MQKFIEYLEEAGKIIQTVDHLVYMTLPIVNDKRLLLKIVKETKTAVSNCINSILQYEYLYKRIRLHSSPKTNFKTFVEKCAPKYRITGEEIRTILELFDIVESHMQSPFEFVRGDKLVIMSNNSTHKTITVEKAKEFIVTSKNILKKAEDIILRKV
ncbi:hypothetical protein GOV13_03910 [Candidatus Pacearchaeota archaeon]|nr:hypothetical protein [Candidatus Pacearchaeota archaeon]